VSRLPALGPRGEGWLAIQIVLMAAIFIACFGAARGSLPAAHLPFGTLVGAALLVIGLIMVALARIQLGSAWTALPRPVAGGQLAQQGIYGIVRNPIYDAVILLGVGGSLLTGSVAGLILAAALAAFLVLKAHREEAWLRQQYPGYDDYARRVKRFIPAIY
jgi:protein-S-isoprenylcysteine O-methyltransferase Ste14